MKKTTKAKIKRAEEALTSEIVRIEYPALKIGKAERNAISDLAKFKTFTIDNDEDLAFANEAFEERRVLVKEINALFKRVESPLRASLAKLQKLRLPTTKALGSTITLLKELIGAYQLAKLEEQQEAYSEVAERVTELDPEELTEALDTAQTAGPVKLAGTSTRFRWKVKRVNFGILDDKYKLYNAGLIEADGDAQNTGTEEQPVIPGVIWELAPDVRATGRRAS